MGRIVKNGNNYSAAPSGALNISFDNKDTTLMSTNVQKAIAELNDKIDNYEGISSSSKQDVIISLLVENWELVNEEYKQSIEVEGLSKDSNPIILLNPNENIATQEEIDAFDCLTNDIIVEDNNIIFTTKSLPEITFKVLIKNAIDSGSSENVNIPEDLVEKIENTEFAVSELNTKVIDLESQVNSNLKTAKDYADTAIQVVKNDLLNGAGEAYDTLKELGELIDENTDAIDALETVATGKADADHNHNDMYYTESEIDSKLSTINTAVEDNANAITNLNGDLVTDLLAEADKGLEARRIVRCDKNTLNTPYKDGLTGTTSGGIAYINMTAENYGQVTYMPDTKPNIYVNYKNDTASEWMGWQKFVTESDALKVKCYYYNLETKNADPGETEYFFNCSDLSGKNIITYIPMIRNHGWRGLYSKIRTVADLSNIDIAVYNPTDGAATSGYLCLNIFYI